MIITTSPKGTEDLLPADSYRWQYLERVFKETAELYNYKEVRVPTFEHTELFERGVGDTTDVVEKQMYTFNDKGGRSVTLRPEGTASVARSFIQNSLYALPMPMKMFYNVLRTSRRGGYANSTSSVLKRSEQKARQWMPRCFRLLSRFSARWA